MFTEEVNGLKAINNVLEIKPCKYCGAQNIKYIYQKFKDGNYHLKSNCEDCGKFQRWEKQTHDVNK